MAWPVVSRSGLFAVALSLAAMPASAELVLPPAWASASSRSRAPGSARVPRVLRQGRPAGPARVQPRVARPGPGAGGGGGAPQVVAIEPGHDAWVTGTEAAVLIEFDAESDTVRRFGLPPEHRHGSP